MYRVALPTNLIVDFCCECKLITTKPIFSCAPVAFVCAPLPPCTWTWLKLKTLSNVVASLVDGAGGAGPATFARQLTTFLTMIFVKPAIPLL